MGDDIILLDGIRYLRFSPDSEAEFERIIVENSKDIFGPEVIYLDIKKRIATALGDSTIPDGYLFSPNENRFVLLEIELSSHDVYAHVTKQISRFISAFDNYRTRQKLASELKNYIESDPILCNRMLPFIKGKGLYAYLFEDIFETLYQQRNYEIIVLIENKTERVIQGLNCLNPKPQIVEVAVYAREDAESVHPLKFKPLWNLQESIRIKKEEKQTIVLWTEEDYRDFLLRLGSGAKCIFWFVAVADGPLNKHDLDKLLDKHLDRDIAPQTVGGFLASVGYQLKKFPNRPYPLNGEWDRERDWKLLYTFDDDLLKAWTNKHLRGFARQKGLL